VPEVKPKRPVPKPMRDMTDAQDLLEGLQRICASRAVKADVELLPELLACTLEGARPEVDIGPIEDENAEFRMIYSDSRRKSAVF
jgi:hypothetical protein